MFPPPPVNPVNTAGFSTNGPQLNEQTVRVCVCVSVDQVVLSLKISKFISNAEIAETWFHFFFFLP